MKTETMKPYPLGLDNPIKVKQVWGSTDWALYWKKDFTHIATYPTQNSALEARAKLIETL